MQKSTALKGLSALGLVLSGTAIPAFAQQTRSNPPIAGTQEQHPLRLAAYQEKPATQSEKTTIKTTERTVSDSGYKGISGFFNIREANANLTKGEWELELNSGWETGNGGDDDLSLGMSIKYGFSDRTYLDLELIPINFGDGSGHGAGELELTLFHQWTSEADSALAFATWASMRIPSGDGSEGIDGTLSGAITKSFGGKWRWHLNGYVMTANGEMGDPDFEDDDGLFGGMFGGLFGNDGDPGRRDFQWGIGPGLDYQFSDDTIGTINWLNRSADQNGENNDNILELGFSHRLADNQGIKFAVDVDVDGANDDVPNVGAKLQWSIAW